MVLEEYGAKAGYGAPRDDLYAYLHAQADALGVGATLAWAAYAWPVAEGGDSYNFAWGSPGTAALEARFSGVEAANARSSASARAREAVAVASMSLPAHAPAHAPSSKAPSAVPVPPFFPPTAPGGGVSGGGGGCVDVQPPSGGDCQAQAAWGKCSASWIVAGGFCRATCKACAGAAGPPTPMAPPPPPLSPAPTPCPDLPPPGSAFSCAAQKSYGQCRAAWMAGHCLASCGGCGGAGGVRAGRVAVPSLAAAGGGNAPVASHPRARVPAPAPTAASPAPSASSSSSALASPPSLPSLPSPLCVDVLPPPSTAAASPAPPPSCAQQKEWGKCGAAFMTRGAFCARTCGRCGVGVVVGGVGPPPAPAPSPRDALAAPMARHNDKKDGVSSAGSTTPAPGGGRHGTPAPAPAPHHPQPTAHPPPFSKSVVGGSEDGLHDVPGSSGGDVEGAAGSAF